MSADRFKVKRGSTSAVNAYLPAQGEPVMDTTLNQLRIGDGTTLGGVALSLVASAIKLATARTLSLTGDVTGSLSFDGSADSSAAVTLASTGVSAGTYVRVTVDTKGRVTAGQTSALAIAQGGTGSNTAAAARTTLGAAASGANSDITSLSGLTTALSVAQGGTGANNAATARINLGVNWFIGADTVYANNTAYTFTHGLGVTPSSIEVYARCITAQEGYSAGVVLSLNTGLLQSGTPADGYGISCAVDATNIYARVAHGGLAAISYTTGQLFVLTPANWRLFVKVYP